MNSAIESFQYHLDVPTRDLLIESAPMMAEWALTECREKTSGGMEEWAKHHNPTSASTTTGCGWYHGTWQLLRLLNMVATPLWYEFYTYALADALRSNPKADVLICAAADYGMLAALHRAIEVAAAEPTLTICDICNTPLLATQWYAQRNDLRISCLCDDILQSRTIPLHAYDLIVTDEFLTVLKSDYKHQAIKRWKELLKPKGVVVTTAMIGRPTTPELRAQYALRAEHSLEANARIFRAAGFSRDDLVERFQRFADFHTRHMMTDEEELERLFRGFKLSYSKTVTPGECVNPTASFQIVASVS